MPSDFTPTPATRIVSDYEAYLFGEGHWLRAWEKMGARPAEIDGTHGYSFVVWGPNARRHATATTALDDAWPLRLSWGQVRALWDERFSRTIRP